MSKHTYCANTKDLTQISNIQKYIKHVHVLLSKVQYKNNKDIVILNVVTIYFVFDTKRMQKNVQ